MDERPERDSAFRPLIEVEEVEPTASEEHAASYARGIAGGDAHRLEGPGCLQHGGGFCPEGERLALEVAPIEPELGGPTLAPPLDLEGLAAPSLRGSEILRPEGP